MELNITLRAEMHQRLGTYILNFLEEKKVFTIEELCSLSLNHETRRGFKKKFYQRCRAFLIEQGFNESTSVFLAEYPKNFIPGPKNQVVA